MTFSKRFLKLSSAFIPNKNARRAFRLKYVNKTQIIKNTGLENVISVPQNLPVFISINGNNNNVTVKKYNSEKVRLTSASLLTLSIKGNDNNIEIEDLSLVAGEIIISVCADKSNVQIKDSLHIEKTLSIALGNDVFATRYKQMENAFLTIGHNASFEECQIVSYNSNTSISIGNDCMFSSKTEIYHTDAHPVYDLESHQIINKVNTFKIGNHCWIGMDAVLMKNVQIADDCIVGRRAVVTKSCLESHCAIGGNPAKTIKRNITWGYGEPAFIENKTES